MLFHIHFDPSERNGSCMVMSYVNVCYFYPSPAVIKQSRFGARPSQDTYNRSLL